MEGQDILKLAESIEKDKDNIKSRRRKFGRKFQKTSCFISAKKSMAVLVLAKQKALKTALFFIRSIDVIDEKKVMLISATETSKKLDYNTEMDINHAILKR